MPICSAMPANWLLKISSSTGSGSECARIGRRSASGCGCRSRQSLAERATRAPLGQQQLAAGQHFRLPAGIDDRRRRRLARRWPGRRSRRPAASRSRTKTGVVVRLRRRSRPSCAAPARGWRGCTGRAGSAASARPADRPPRARPRSPAAGSRARSRRAAGARASIARRRSRRRAARRIVRVGVDARDTAGRASAAPRSARPATPSASTSRARRRRRAARTSPPARPRPPRRSG